jgi:hypothetical protein
MILFYIFVMAIMTGLGQNCIWAEAVNRTQKTVSPQVKNSTSDPSKSIGKKSNLGPIPENDEEEEDFSSLFILDPMTFTDVTEQELSQSAEALRKMESLNLQLLSRGETSVVSGKLTCEDVLGGVMNTPTDADVNLICQNCYSFCMMEMVILQYAEILKKKQKMNSALEKRVKADLLLLKKLLPAFLDSCAAAYWAFKDGKLRAKINELQKQAQDQDRKFNSME